MDVICIGNELDGETRVYEDYGGTEYLSGSYTVDSGQHRNFAHHSSHEQQHVLGNNNQHLINHNNATQNNKSKKKKKRRHR